MLAQLRKAPEGMFLPEDLRIDARGVFGTTLRELDREHRYSSRRCLRRFFAEPTTWRRWERASPQVL
jgi:hypothetical protein